MDDKVYEMHMNGFWLFFEFEFLLFTLMNIGMDENRSLKIRHCNSFGSFKFIKIWYNTIMIDNDI